MFGYAFPLLSNHDSCFYTYLRHLRIPQIHIPRSVLFILTLDRQTYSLCLLHTKVCTYAYKILSSSLLLYKYIWMPVHSSTLLLTPSHSTSPHRAGNQPPSSLPTPQTCPFPNPKEGSTQDGAIILPSKEAPRP